MRRGARTSCLQNSAARAAGRSRDGAHGNAAGRVRGISRPANPCSAADVSPWPRVVATCDADVLGTPFRLTQEAMEHILLRHYVNGAQFGSNSDDSYFFSSVDPVQLARGAAEVGPLQQPGSSRLAYIAASPEDVGITGAQGDVTNVYTIITESDGTVVTAFPRVPRWYNGPLP